MDDSEYGASCLAPHSNSPLPTSFNYLTSPLNHSVSVRQIPNAYPEELMKQLGMKERDKAEKFFRNLKEGIELHPVRHWNKWSVIGIFFICFLANFLINLTLLLSENTPVKNAKLLKKFLINLSLTVVYPPKGFRFHILSNVSPQIANYAMAVLLVLKRSNGEVKFLIFKFIILAGK